MTPKLMKRPSLAWKPHESAVANARRVLPELLRDYFESGRKLDESSSAVEMHGFRLKTKHLRYTLEAFVSLYGPGLKTKLATLRPIQNALGDLNDCEVMLSDLGKRLPHEVETYVRGRAGEKQREFLRYWREEFDANDGETKWERYLTRFARARAAR
jgi:CHAD domain-containing protein